MIHAEVILQGDGGEGLSGCLYLHTLLGLDCLMKSIAPTTTFHDTTCLFIDNLHLAVHDDIVVVLHEHGVGLEQLLDGMHTLCLQGIVLHEGILLGKLVVFALELFCFEFSELGGDIWKHEELVVLHNVGNELVTLISHFHRLQFLIHHEEQWFDGFWHASVVVLHVDFLRLEQTCLDTRL